MPLQALRTVSKSQNGVGAFILQCKRLDFHYCDWAGSSKGMNAFIKHHLADFAVKNPEIEITVSPRPNQHPVVRGSYVNGKEKAICVRNLHPNQIIDKVELLKNANGEKNFRTKKTVTSVNQSVRGIWSPFHGPNAQV